MATGQVLGQVKVGQVASMKLMEEFGNFFGRQHSWQSLQNRTSSVPSAHHLLPPQCPPTYIVLSPSLKMVSDSDFTPALRSGSDIAADAKAAALILVLYLLTHVGPPPILQQSLHLFTRFAYQVLPVEVRIALIFVIDSCCIMKTLQSVALYCVTSLHITTLNRASHKTLSFLPPSVHHQRAHGLNLLVYIGAWSLHVNLVHSLCCCI